MEYAENHSENSMTPLMQETLYSSNKQHTPFFSKLTEVIKAKMGGKMPYADMVKMLKSNQVTDDEIENLVGELADKQIVTKTEVLEAIQANSVELKDVVLGEQDAHGEQQGEIAGITDTTAFSRKNSFTGKAIGAKELGVVIDRFTSGLRNAPDIHTFETISDLLSAVPEIKEEADKQGKDLSDVNGIYHNGAVYLIRMRLTSIADAEEVLFHEAFGHYGVRSLLGNDFADKMLELHNAIGGSSGLARIAKNNGVNLASYGQASAKAGYMPVWWTKSLMPCTGTIPARICHDWRRLQRTEGLTCLRLKGAGRRQESWPHSLPKKGR